VIGPHDDALREQVLRLAPTAEQEIFSGRAEQTLPAAEADEARTPFAILHGERAVGFGVLDRAGYLADLVDDPARAVLLRAFYLDASAQGRGWGRQAARQIPDLAAQVTDAELVVLTVNERNPRAVRAYLRAGFTDTGTRYLDGSAGPQHVLVARTGR
jgi:RimJ/RimL family protein N-acetyltransferase